MMYQSTRNNRVQVTSAQAIVQGISADGGLYVPESFPKVSLEEIGGLASLPYAERAQKILRLFLTDFSEEELRSCTQAAYPGGFRVPEVAPVKELGNGQYLLELFHGPTCAFKDMALQILPHLMRVSASKAADGKEIVILVATSGDTGKAALEGFRDAEHTRILVFYPEDGVSPMQKLQMTTQEGNNVAVCAIQGNFDDAQSGVKAIFTDPAVAERLAAKNRMFSSANSINWGRLVPQIVYYFSAYAELLKAGAITCGDAVNFVVPTGNFGNILAAYYAKQMGLPVGRLICASNRNRVLTDFLTEGVYDRNRAFYTTTSPSMDILISSNLERLLYEMTGRDDACVADWMNQLKADGKYEIPSELLSRLHEEFAAGCADDAQAAAAIRTAWENSRTVCDPHTGVALHVAEEYRQATGDTTPTVVVSTASPYKFPASVLSALGNDGEGDEFANLETLSRLTETEIPAPLASIRDKKKRFTQVISRENMTEAVFDLLGV